MSNLQNTTRLPLRTTMMNKAKLPIATNDLLERKTRALEGRLNKLKLNMQPDQIKTTNDIQRRKSTKDLSQNTRDKSSENSVSTKSKLIIKCGQCERNEAKMRCLECVEHYCANCFTQFHLRGALQRHHRILLQKKSQTLTSDNLQEKSPINEKDEIHHDKSNLVSFQQSFLQWRDNNINKSQQKHRALSPTTDKIENSNKLPTIEFNSTKKSQHEIKNTQSKKTKDHLKTDTFIPILELSSENTNSNELTINLEPLNDELSTTTTAESIEIIPVKNHFNNNHKFEQNEEQARPITHVSIKSFSRPTSASITSRPNSLTLTQQSLRSLLTTKSTDELKAIIDSQLILSRPLTATSEKVEQPLNEIPIQNTSNHINVQPIVNEQNSITQFDTASDDVFDDSKIESNYQMNYSLENMPQIISTKDQLSTHVFCMNSTTPTPGRDSPFSFSNPLYKASQIGSSSSSDTPDGGFFTDVLPRKMITSPIPPPPIPPPPPILECSTSNEWKHPLESQSIEQNQMISNSISLPKLSAINLSDVSSKHPIPHEEILQQSKSQIDNSTRPESSLSSSSLPLSTTSSRKTSSPTISNTDNSASPTSTEKNSSLPTTKTTSSETTTTQTSSAATLTTDSSSTIKSSSTEATTTNTASTATSEKSSSQTSTPKPTINNSSSETTIMNTSSTITSEKTSSQASTPKPIINNSPSQPELIIPVITNDKKETTPSDHDRRLSESINSIKDKNLSNVHPSNNSNNLTKSNLKILTTRKNSINDKDLSTKKKTRERRHRRQTLTSDESSKYRKLEFSVGDGLKWQEASMESMSSTVTTPSKQPSSAPTPRLLTPSNPKNIEIAEQFNKYDVDDGRSSPQYQDMNDEECFNQLCQELCSDLTVGGSDEDAILNDQILKILQSARKPFTENNFLMINKKFRENETVHQPSVDNELLIHE